MTNLPLPILSHRHTRVGRHPGLQTTASGWPIPPAPDTDGATPVERVSGRYCGPRPARPSRAASGRRRQGFRDPIAASARQPAQRRSPPEQQRSNRASAVSSKSQRAMGAATVAGSRSPAHARSATDLDDNDCSHDGARRRAIAVCVSRRARRPSTAAPPRCPTGPRRTATSQTCGSTSIPGAGSSRPTQNKALARRAHDPATPYVAN
jgi:hypothetical protein